MNVPKPPFRTVSEELLYSIYLKLPGGGNMPGLTKEDINTLAKLNAILQDAVLMSADQIGGAIAALKGDVPEVANSLEKLYNIVRGITALKREDIDTIEELNAILTNADLLRIDDLAEALAALNLKRRTIEFFFSDDHWKEGHPHHHPGDTHVLRGKINSLEEDFTSKLLGVTYKTRLDASSSWVDHLDLSSLQHWINTNIVGNEGQGTVYWIRCLPVYKEERDREKEKEWEAVNVFVYDAIDI
jgi:hypothetical protein